MSETKNVVAYMKGGQRFLFLFTDSRVSEAISCIGAMADNQDIDFNFSDAAFVAQKAREMVPKNE